MKLSLDVRPDSRGMASYPFAARASMLTSADSNIDRLIDMVEAGGSSGGDVFSGSVTELSCEQPERDTRTRTTTRSVAVRRRIMVEPPSVRVDGLFNYFHQQVYADVVPDSDAPSVWFIWR
jgi:hypothetical protein